jgi:hypothetical protein
MLDLSLHRRERPAPPAIGRSAAHRGWVGKGSAQRALRVLEDPDPAALECELSVTLRTADEGEEAHDVPWTFQTGHSSVGDKGQKAATIDSISLQDSDLGHSLSQKTRSPPARVDGTNELSVSR